VQRTPDRQEDQSATWSLSLLRKALRATDLPHIASETIRQVLHASGYSFQQTRTWCRTGYALRKRKSGTVMVYDQQTLEKKRLIELACEHAEAAGLVQLNARRSRTLPSHPAARSRRSSQKDIPLCIPMNMSVEARPNC
jgi:hypothetical protein